MKCAKCGNESLSKIVVKRDTRGVPSAYCAVCGSYIKKMSTGEVIDVYEARIAGLIVDDIASVEDVAVQPAPEPKEKMPCRYCTERYVMVQGHERTRMQYVPIEAQYCPMCGRKLKASDRAY